MGEGEKGGREREREILSSKLDTKQSVNGSHYQMVVIPLCTKTFV